MSKWVPDKHRNYTTWSLLDEPSNTQRFVRPGSPARAFRCLFSLACIPVSGDNESGWRWRRVTAPLVTTACTVRR